MGMSIPIKLVRTVVDSGTGGGKKHSAGRSIVITFWISHVNILRLPIIYTERISTSTYHTLNISIVQLQLHLCLSHWTHVGGAQWKRFEKLGESKYWFLVLGFFCCLPCSRLVVLILFAIRGVMLLISFPGNCNSYSRFRKC